MWLKKYVLLSCHLGWMNRRRFSLQKDGSEPSYLHNLITVQPPHSTRSSSLVTLACSSSLRITDRFFQYASRRLWNHLSASLYQPRTNLSNFDSHSPIVALLPSVPLIHCLLSSSITPAVIHSRLKTFVTANHDRSLLLLQDWLHRFCGLFNDILSMCFCVLILFIFPPFSCRFRVVD